MGPGWGSLFCHAGGQEPTAVLMRRCARPAVRRLCCIKERSIFGQTNPNEGVSRVPDRRRRGGLGTAGDRNTGPSWENRARRRQQRAVREVIGGGEISSDSDASSSDSDR